MQDSNQTGDVYVSVGNKNVYIDEAENIHIKKDSIGENLIIKDAGFVYTGQRTSEYESSDTDVNDSGIRYSGSDMEDVYVENVESSLVIEGADDVFIEPDSVSGKIINVGSENVFQGDVGSPDRETVTESVFGWDNVAEVKQPEEQVIVLGSKCDVTISNVRDEVTVYVTGWHNDVRVAGRGSVHLNVVGSKNKLSCGGLINVDLSDVGKDNVANQDPFPADELIDKRREEAYTDASFGKDTVTYQRELKSKDECPVCTSKSDAIVETTTETCFFLFGQPVHKYDKVANYTSCERCTEGNIPDVSLDDEDLDKIV